MTAPERRVPMRYMQLLLQCLQEWGLEPGRVLAEAGLQAEYLEARDVLLTQAEVDSLLQVAGRISGRSDLGFELGRRVKMNSHDLLGYGLMSAPDMDGFFRMASRHYHLIIETWTMHYHRWPAGAEVVYTPLVGLSKDSMQFYLEAIALAHQNQMALTLGEHLQPYDFYLSMEAPAHAARYATLAPARFHFQAGAAPGMRVIMPAAMLERPLPLSNPDVMRDIDARCTAIGRTPPRGGVGWSAYIMMALREAQGTHVTLEDIARRVNVSARTIDRQLKKEGQGFRELSDRVRFERASTLLCAPGSTIAETAARLGFSDAANFSRAFKRVRGMSPGEYQRSVDMPSSAMAAGS